MKFSASVEAEEPPAYKAQLKEHSSVLLKQHVLQLNTPVAPSPPVLRPTQEIVSSTWYDHYYGTEDSYLAVLIPNPFRQRSSLESWRVPVGTEECGQSRATCNGKLKDNEQYR